MAENITHSRNGTTYAMAGVNIDAGNAVVDLIRPIVQSTSRTGASGKIGGFGGVFDLKAAAFNDPLLVATTDGVGTKVKVAIESKKHETIGIDLVAMCVNDLVVQGASPLFFLDYYATGTLIPPICKAVIQGIATGCKEAGCALIGGETAEMPGMYQNADYDLAGFAVGAVERERLLPRPDIASGDLLLGIASSGIHANGFSLVRKIVQDAGLDWKDPAPFSPSESLADALLTPTRIYVHSVQNVLKHHSGIKAIAHITGGGIIENVPRVLPEGFCAKIDLSCIRPQPVFSWLSQSGSISQEEMLRTFNCGVGMVLIVSAEQAEAITETLQDSNETVYPLGTILNQSELSSAGMPIHLDANLPL